MDMIFADWKIGYVIKLIMAKHVDAAAYKFYGKELRISSHTPVNFMTEWA